MIVGYYKNYLYTTDISSALKEKKNKESQYMVSHPETSSDSPIGRTGIGGVTVLLNYRITIYKGVLIKNIHCNYNSLEKTNSKKLSKLL